MEVILERERAKLIQQLEELPEGAPNDELILKIKMNNYEIQLNKAIAEGNVPMVQEINKTLAGTRGELHRIQQLSVDGISTLPTQGISTQPAGSKASLGISEDLMEMLATRMRENLELIKEVKIMVSSQKNPKTASRLSQGDYQTLGIRQNDISFNSRWLDDVRESERKVALEMSLKNVLRRILEILKSNQRQENDVRKLLDPFFRDMSTLLIHSSTNVRDEVRYQTTISCLDGSEMKLKGIIGQAVYVSQPSFPLLAIEDKSLNVLLSYPQIAQTMAGVVSMSDALVTTWNIFPSECCSILTNGCEWMLVRHLRRGDLPPVLEHSPVFRAMNYNPSSSEWTMDNAGINSVFQLLAHSFGIARNLLFLYHSNHQPHHSVSPSTPSSDRKPSSRSRGSDRKDKVNKDHRTSNHRTHTFSRAPGNNTKGKISATALVLSSRNLNRCGVNEYRSIDRFTFPRHFDGVEI